MTESQGQNWKQKLMSLMSFSYPCSPFLQRASCTAPDTQFLRNFRKVQVPKSCWFLYLKGGDSQNA